MVDDVWFSTGSANMNYRSYTTDMELNVATVDRAIVTNADGHNVAKLAHDARVKMWAEVAGIKVDEMTKMTYAQGVKTMVSGPKSLVASYDFTRTWGIPRSVCGATDPDMRTDEQKAARLKLPMYKMRKFFRLC